LNGDNVAKFWSRIDDRFGVEAGRPEMLRKSVPEASSESYWGFMLRDIGKGKIIFGLRDLFEERDERDEMANTFEECYIYVSLLVKPEGWRFPLFGNHSNRADRLAFKCLEHLKNIFDMPLSAHDGDTPWLWDDKYCSYSVDKRSRDSVLISVLSLHNAPGYRHPVTGAPDPSYWD
jgi:hypothetical protein